MLWKMALRNLWKNKRRTIITLASIAFGLLLSLTFTGIGDYSYTNMINGAARMGSGHASVIPDGYLDTPTLDKTIRDINKLTQRIEASKSVTACVPRIVGQTMISTPKDSVGAAFIAIDPDQESSESAFYLDYINEGKLFSKDSKKGIVIGRKMADRLKVGLGNKLVYTTTDKNGEITSGLARVSGIFETGASEADGYLILLPIDRMRSILAYEPDEATQLAIFLDDHHRADRLVEQIQAFTQDPTKQAVTWRSTSPDMAGWVAMDSTVNYLFQIIIFLMVAAGILNTILMSVLERTREFGIMMAIGMSPSRLIGLVLAEAVWVGIFGIIAGLVVTAPLYWYLHTDGLDLSGMFTDSADVAGVIFDPTIYNDLRLESLIVIIIGAFLITLLSGIYPAFKAGRVQPVESIKTL